MRQEGQTARPKSAGCRWGLPKSLVDERARGMNASLNACMHTCSRAVKRYGRTGDRLPDALRGGPARELLDVPEAGRTDDVACTVHRREKDHLGRLQGQILRDVRLLDVAAVAQQVQDRSGK